MADCTENNKPAAIKHSTLIQWHNALAKLIDSTAEEEFPDELIAGLNRLIHFDFAAVIVFRGRARPATLGHTFPENNGASGVDIFVQNTFVLSPFYQAYIKGLSEGVYRMADLAPDAYFESGYQHKHRVKILESEEIGYVTDHWPQGLSEVDMAVRLDEIAFIEFSIYRLSSSREFLETELDLLKLVHPVLASLLRRHWRDRASQNVNSTPPDYQIDTLFETFGEGILSDREQEVVQMILRGHSSESISLNLGISLSTVKSHRRNAYAKLNISSQSELLNLFLQALSELGSS